MLLLLTALSGCGGGGGGSGGFVGPDSITITLRVERSTLPPNTTGVLPISQLYTTTVFATVRNSDGTPLGGGTVQFTIDSLEHGALYETDLATKDDNGNPQAFKSLTDDLGGGVASVLFHAFSRPGPTTVQATIADPNSGQIVEATVVITVAPGASTGEPANVTVTPEFGAIFTAGVAQPDAVNLNILVLDDGGQLVPNPPGNNVRVVLLAGRPNGGEELVGVNSSGATVRGLSIDVPSVNGVAQVSFRAGSLPGTARIGVTVDRDNSVDNGVTGPISDVTTISMSDGQPYSLTFTGPYIGAVQNNANSLDLDPPQFSNGTFNRLISVIANDRFGNVVPQNTQVNFFLIDAPLSGYPNQGRGTFDITGTDGNLAEGGFTFTTLASSLAGAQLFDLLAFDGRKPDQVGGRIINGIAGPMGISVTNAFNPGTDSGFTVPYTIGRPISGNIESVGFTDANGVASTRMNYPITALGRHIILMAEANGGKVGAVLDAYYLGNDLGAELSIIGPAGFSGMAATLSTSVGQTVSQSFTLQLTGGCIDANENGACDADEPIVGNPLPAEAIAWTVDINDPDHEAALTARDDADQKEAEAEAKRAAAEAQAAVEPILSNDGNDTGMTYGSCANLMVIDINGIDLGDGSGGGPDGDTDDADDVAPGLASTTFAGQLCEDAKMAEEAAVEAGIAADTAEAIDALHDPTVTVMPSILVTDANGEVQSTVTVSDLPQGGSATITYAAVQVPASPVVVTVSASSP